MKSDGQSQCLALNRGFGYLLSLLSNWFHMSKVGVRLLTQVWLQTQNLQKYVLKYNTIFLCIKNISGQPV